MLTKIYKLTWLATILAAAIFLITGNFGMMAGVIFGFIVFGLIFMGMIAVLPSSVSHPAPKAAAPDLASPSFTESTKNRVAKATASWSPGLEMRKPRFH